MAERAAGIQPAWHYWVEPGRFAAGAYPVSNECLAASQMRALLAEGFDTFISLTADHERGLPPYRELAVRLGAQRGLNVALYSFAMQDMSVPSMEMAKSLLDTIGTLLAGRHRVYLHCRAGLGRTGTIVGCWLVRGGLSSDDALRRVRELAGREDSPETPEQCAFVRDWQHQPAAS